MPITAAGYKTMAAVYIYPHESTHHSRLPDKDDIVPKDTITPITMADPTAAGYRIKK